MTTRYARLIAGWPGACRCRRWRVMPGLSWISVKAIECAHLAETMPIPPPRTLAGIRYLGVDEVARARASYFTLAYDLAWRSLRPHPVGQGKAASRLVLANSLDALPGLRRRRSGRDPRHGG